jgi:phosphocarrier protein HPr
MRVKESDMLVEKMVAIKNKQGLHARPAALFVQIANKFNCDITISKGKQKVNGKSIMGIMMLEAGIGSKVTIAAHGEDAEQAVKELETLLLSDDIDDIVI